jgi:hypothetical protein
MIRRPGTVPQKPAVQALQASRLNAARPPSLALSICGDFGQEIF